MKNPLRLKSIIMNFITCSICDSLCMQLFILNACFFKFAHFQSLQEWAAGTQRRVRRPCRVFTRSQPTCSRISTLGRTASRTWSTRPGTSKHACRNSGTLDYRNPAKFHFFKWFGTYDKIVCKYTWFVCKNSQNCPQMSHLAGILDSSIPGFLQAWFKEWLSD